MQILALIATVVAFLSKLLGFADKLQSTKEAQDASDAHGLRKDLDAIEAAQAARQQVDIDASRDPSSVMRSDKFKRPDSDE